MNFEEIIKSLGNNLIPALKIFSFAIFGTSIIVFYFSDQLNKNYGDWPYDLEQTAIISFLFSGFILVFILTPSIINFFKSKSQEIKIKKLATTLTPLEEKILFSMSLTPEKPLIVSDFCKYEAPKSQTSAEVFSAVADLKAKKLVKAVDSEMDKIFLTDWGIKNSIKIQKRSL